MGIVAVPKFVVPPTWLDDTGVIKTIAAATDRIAHVFAVTKSGTLDKFEFQTQSTVSVNAASVIRVSFRSVVAGTGEPGAVDQFRDILGSALAANTWTSPGLMTDDGTDTGAKRVVTRGDLICIVIEYQSFTAGDDIDISTIGGRSTAAKSGACDGFPYDLFQSGGSWDLSPATDSVRFALLYDDATYGRPISPGHAGATDTAIGFSATLEIGNIFTLVFPIRVTGAHVAVYGLNPADVYEVVLLDTDGTTELETVIVDGDHEATSDNLPRFVPFAAEHELGIGTYRLIVRPTTGVAFLLYFGVDATEQLESAFNLNWHGTFRDGGGWTENDLRFYKIGLVINGLEEGSTAVGGPGGGALSDRGFVRGMIS